MFLNHVHITWPIVLLFGTGLGILIITAHAQARAHAKKEYEDAKAIYDSALRAKLPADIVRRCYRRMREASGRLGRFGG